MPATIVLHALPVCHREEQLQICMAEYLFNPVFGSSQALGGHRGNSIEHKERVAKLKKEGSITLLEHGQQDSNLIVNAPAHVDKLLVPESAKYVKEHDTQTEGKGKAAWGLTPAPPPAPFQVGCKVEVSPIHACLHPVLRGKNRPRFCPVETDLHLAQRCCTTMAFGTRVFWRRPEMQASNI